mmetsp:Transcript_21244/g.27875  ORF Transcript_21244/g.27875 Transcript_21244/m.27875 type:complete len:87 (-) Transcript_21244:2651-2911(-)
MAGKSPTNFGSTDKPPAKVDFPATSTSLSTGRLAICEKTVAITNAINEEGRALVYLGMILIPAAVLRARPNEEYRDIPVKDEKTLI